MIEIIIGNLFDSKEKYIAHQTNCISQKAAHLAKDIFKHYPYADIYTGRVEPNKPGTIDIKGNGQDKRYVISLFGQYYPGSPKYPSSSLDGTSIREKYFYQCLLKVAKIENLESIAFPYKIGCGAAGGNWEYYFNTIVNMEKFLNIKGVKVVIYRREND